MIIIGEKLNSSVPATLEALNTDNFKFIIEMIKNQASCGADYIDINTALMGDREAEYMNKIIDLVIANSNCGIMLDSPNPEIILSCIKNVKDRKVLINSITLEEKFDVLVDAAAKFGANIVCLPIDSKLIPESPKERLENAGEIIAKLKSKNIPEEKIFIDILIESVATNGNAAQIAIETLRLVKSKLPNIKTICGLSNISFGLPARLNINSYFLSMLLQNGIDSAIMDSLSVKMKNTILSHNVLTGKDEYCMDYITAIREQM